MASYFNWYTVSIDLLLLIGIVYFFKLPKEKRSHKGYWVPLTILAFTVFYENMGSFTLSHNEFNSSVNSFLGNTGNPEYNVWLKNITFGYLGLILYLALIRQWIVPSRKKILTAFILTFSILSPIIWWLEIEPFYLSQSVVFALGANLILVGCGLYFIGLITDKKYLESNPIRLLSFWQTTFILFTYSLTYINSVSLVYIYNINPDLADSLIMIDMVLGIINLSILALILASPSFPKIFQTEPYYGV